MERVDPHQSNSNSHEQEDDQHEVKASRLNGLLILTPFPAKALGDVVRDPEHNLKGGPKTGCKQCNCEEQRAKGTKRFRHGEAKFTKRTRLHIEWLQDHRTQKNEGNGAEAAKTHPHNRCYAVQ